MKISENVFWILIGSVVAAIALTIGAILWMYLRKKRLIKAYQAKQVKEQKELLKIRPNAGELLWEQKNQTSNPLDDFQMEFAINTVFRNNYAKFSVHGFTSSYEKDSLAKLSKSKFVDHNYNFLLINGDVANLNDFFDQAYKLLKPQEMIMIVNASRKKTAIKDLLAYLKIIKARYDWSKYGPGVLVVVK